MCIGNEEMEEFAVFMCWDNEFEDFFKTNAGSDDAKRK